MRYVKACKIGIGWALAYLAYPGTYLRLPCLRRQLQSWQLATQAAVMFLLPWDISCQPAAFTIDDLAFKLCPIVDLIQRKKNN